MMLAVADSSHLERLDVPTVAAPCADPSVYRQCHVVPQRRVRRAPEALGTEYAGGIEAAVPAAVHGLASAEDVTTDHPPPPFAVLPTLVSLQLGQAPIVLNVWIWP
jgi:hypothetical protein